MSEIEETVSLLETMIDWHHLYGCEPQVRALISDWRKRGEALERIADEDRGMWAGQIALAALTPP